MIKRTLLHFYIYAITENGPVIQGMGTRTLQTYVDRRNMTLAEWVALRTIFEICANETGYDGGGSHQEPWWWQVAENKQLRAMLEEILAAAKERRRWEFSRRGGGKIWEEKIDSESDGLEGGG